MSAPVTTAWIASAAMPTVASESPATLMRPLWSMYTWKSSTCAKKGHGGCTMNVRSRRQNLRTMRMLCGSDKPV